MSSSMPWGKYEGEVIENLPTAYLDWYVNHFDGCDLYGEAYDIYDEISVELACRRERWAKEKAASRKAASSMSPR